MSERPGKPEGGAKLPRQEALAVLRKYWGHADFRPGQWEVIAALLSGRDALAVLPTGTGKSVCYQLPALLKPGLTLVISPLIALMRDQVEGLRRRGISATAVDSTLSSREIDQRLTDAEFGKYRLLYLAPERLSSSGFEARCSRLQIHAVIVDEAHCVSEWGHSFRPSYLDIAGGVEKIGKPVVVALTATATPRVRSDISSLLGLVNPVKVVTGFDRPNIEWSVVHTDDKRRRVLALLRQDPGSVVLYTGTRRGAESWDQYLQSRGIDSVHYHGGLSAQVREVVQADWTQGRARVMVATSAFGMGIDKPDVRHVIHVDLPMSLEAYYQEAGRAGRDNLPSRATLICGTGDDRLPRTLIESSYPSAERIEAVYNAACSLGGVAVGSTPQDPLDLNLGDVARVAEASASQVRQAAEYIERMGAWVITPSGEYGHLRMRSDPESLRSLVAEGRAPAIRSIANHFLRGGQGDSWGSWSRIDADRLAGRLKVTRPELEQALQYLDMVGHISWRAPGSTLRLVLVEPRHRRPPVRHDLVKKSRRGAVDRLEDLIRYTTHRDCRRNYILTYFGQSAPVRCGRCDNCRGGRAGERGQLDRDLIRAVLAAVRSGQRNEEWGLDLGWSLDQLDECVDWLVREGYLQVAPTADLTLELTEKGKGFL